MAAGVVLVMIQTYIHLRYKFRRMSGLRTEEPQAAQQVRQELANWEHAAQSLSSTSNDANLVRERMENKIVQLKKQLKKQLSTGKIPNEVYRETLRELQQKVNHRHQFPFWVEFFINYKILSLFNSIRFGIGYC